MKVSALVLFVVFVSAAVGTPVKVKGSRSTTVEHPFDLGPLTTCVQAPDTTVCPSVDYPIPAVLASSINSRIIPIRSALRYVSSQADATCQNSFRRELCNLYLPRCTEESNGTQSVSLHFNCTRVLADCPSSKHANLRGYCPEVGQLTGTYPLENCKPSSEQNRIVSNHSLCDDYVDAAMPKWLQAHAKVYGNNLQSLYDIIRERPGIEDCIPNWLNVSCQSFGRCWAQGERMEHSHSKEQCQSVEICLNQLPQSIFALVQTLLGCGNFPREDSWLLTEATLFTTMTPTQVTSTSSERPTHPHGTVAISLPTSSSSCPTHSLLSIFVVVLFVLMILSL